MPLYEYLCKKCKHRFEKIQKYSDKMLKKCPECGGVIEQTITAPAVQFKGSGWYVTDYAKNTTKAASGSATQDAEAASGEAKPGDSAKDDGAKKEKKAAAGEESKGETGDKKKAEDKGKAVAKKR